MNGLGSPITVMLLAVFASMVVIATGYPADARLMPLAIGLAGAALCLLQLAIDLNNTRRWRRKNRFHAAPKLGRPEVYDTGAADLGPHTLAGEIAMWGYFLAFIAALLVLGFYVAVPVMLFFFLRRVARTRTVAAAAAAGAGGTIPPLFGKLLGFELFPGLAWSTVIGTLLGG